MVKVDVVSGFLGAGKTTLIKKLLKVYGDENIVLIENEFGDVGIDGDIIKTEGFDVVEITSGCICCSMKKDFQKSFNEVLEKFNPERVIIEPTGINILSQILNILKGSELEKKCIINSIITVIDAVNYLDHIDIFGEFFQDQIINARTLIISKSQMVQEDVLGKIICSLRELNCNAEITAYDWSEMTEDSIKDLFKADITKDFQELFHSEVNSSINHKFHTLGIKTVKKFTKNEIVQILKKLKSNQYGNVIRAKGFLKGEKEDLEFSYASGQYEICKTSNPSIGKLCIIGQSLKEKEIKALFEAKFLGLLRW